MYKNTVVSRVEIATLRAAFGVLERVTGAAQPVAVVGAPLVGLARPLWRDVSKHNGKVDYAVMFANGVQGVFARAGISWGYQDQWFPANWLGAGDHELWRSSYHVIYLAEKITPQADNWYRSHPEIETIPRVIDMEVDQGVHPYTCAEQMWKMSEIILARDGVRPIIYSRVNLINPWLQDWSADELNAHYYFLAQYTWDRVREHPGPPDIPIMVRTDRVLWQQTADKKAPFPGEMQSYSADYGRWLRGDIAQQNRFIADQWGGMIIPPVPPIPADPISAVLAGMDDSGKYQLDVTVKVRPL